MAAAGGASAPTRVALVISGSMNKLEQNWSHWPSVANHVIRPLARSAEVFSFLCINANDALPPREVMDGWHVVSVLRNVTGTAADTWRKDHPGQPLNRDVSV